MTSVVEDAVFRTSPERSVIFAPEGGGEGNAGYFFTGGLNVSGDDAADPFNIGVNFRCSGCWGWGFGHVFACCVEVSVHLAREFGAFGHGSGATSILCAQIRAASGGAVRD